MSTSFPRARDTRRHAAGSSSGPDLSVTSEYWGKEDGLWYRPEWVHWRQHPAVERRINEKLADRADWDLFYYWLKKYLVGRAPVERALSLGCGVGGLERGLAKYGFAQDHLGLDVSEGAIRRARRLAEQEGYDHLLRYEVADLNVATLPEKQFDAILGVSAIHHVEELERLFEQIDFALKDGGFLFMDEFVGPNQFQWGEKQVEIANRMLRCLPPEYRRSARIPGEIKEYVAVNSIEEMNRVDPTESIRSEAIIPLVYHYFDVIEIRGYGGSLLHLVLDDIAGNFDPDNDHANGFLRMLFEIEDLAIKAGDLQHDFVALTAKKRSLAPRKQHERLAPAQNRLKPSLAPWPG